MSHLIDMTGQRFGRLTVIERVTPKPKEKYAYWKCLCDCGNEKVVTGSRLRSGDSRSCGCLRSEKMELKYIKNDPDWKKKKREYQKSTPCPYNEGCQCTKKDCWRCGFNPKVAKARTEKFMEGFNG